MAKQSGKGTASTYIPEGCAKYVHSNAVEKSLHLCATYVKKGLVDAVSGKINNNVYFSCNGCAVSQWLPYFGFQIVCSGDTKPVPEGFVPQDGDIMVHAGFSGAKMGHVAVYSSNPKRGCGSNGGCWNDGHWIADFATVNPGPYSSGCLYVIFRK